MTMRPPSETRSQRRILLFENAAAMDMILARIVVLGTVLRRRLRYGLRARRQYECSDLVGLPSAFVAGVTVTKASPSGREIEYARCDLTGVADDRQSRAVAME